MLCGTGQKAQEKSRTKMKNRRRPRPQRHERTPREGQGRRRRENNTAAPREGQGRSGVRGRHRHQEKAKAAPGVRRRQQHQEKAKAETACEEGCNKRSQNNQGVVRRSNDARRTKSSNSVVRGDRWQTTTARPIKILWSAPRVAVQARILGARHNR